MFVLYIYCLLCVLSCFGIFVFFFKQKTAYEMRISDWSSDVCSSDLYRRGRCCRHGRTAGRQHRAVGAPPRFRRGDGPAFLYPVLPHAASTASVPRPEAGDAMVAT